uniref:Uncharacterized protein n=1 Tax=Favella ehrenbergii TaxID=182087 RepID=A0A7S3MP45_9SPIT
MNQVGEDGVVLALRVHTLRGRFDTENNLDLVDPVVSSEEYQRDSRLLARLMVHANGCERAKVFEAVEHARRHEFLLLNFLHFILPKHALEAVVELLVVA